ncbi:hypothetical protein [Salmonella enterica]
MIKIVLSLFLFLYVGMGYGKEKNNISTLCDTDIINKLEIVYYPKYISTNVAMSAEQLMLRYIYKIEINDVQDTPFRDEIIKMLNVDYFERKNTNDIRWGVRIFSEKNKICNLYFDDAGICGKIDDMNVCFKKKSIIEWVENRVPLFVQYDNHTQ